MVKRGKLGWKRGKEEKWKKKGKGGKEGNWEKIILKYAA